jgi:hypothetical protein
MFPLLLLLGLGGFAVVRWNASTPKAKGNPQKSPASSPNAPSSKAIPGILTREQLQAAIAVHLAKQNAAIALANQQAQITSAASMYRPPVPMAPLPPIVPYSPPPRAGSATPPQPSQASQIIAASMPLVNALGGQAGINPGITSGLMGIGSAVAAGGSTSTVATDMTVAALNAASSYQSGDASSVPTPSDD